MLARVIRRALILTICLSCLCARADYVVQKGDTLGGIAGKTLGSASRWGEIAELNNLAEPYHLRIGQRLAIPSRQEFTNPPLPSIPSPPPNPTVVPAIVDPPDFDLPPAKEDSIPPIVLEWLAWIAGMVGLMVFGIFLLIVMIQLPFNAIGVKFGLFLFGLETSWRKALLVGLVWALLWGIWLVLFSLVVPETGVKRVPHVSPLIPLLCLLAHFLAVVFVTSRIAECSLPKAVVVALIGQFVAWSVAHMTLIFTAFLLGLVWAVATGLF